MNQPAHAKSPETTLREDIGEYFADPLGYCYYAFPWTTDRGIQVCKTPEPWASKYDSEFGLDKWQCEFFDKLGEEIKARGFNPDALKSVMPIETAIRSGHGIGKSALVGMLVSFIMDTRPGSRGMITANTGAQLSSKTWPQVKKWKQLACTSHWWRVLEARIVHVDVDKPNDGEKYGLAEAITWDKNRSEAFAGQHAVNATSFYLFDEASAINDKIFEVSRGGLSDGEPMHFSFGNPTRNVGAFHRCFTKRRHRMAIVEDIDSRSSQITNKELIQAEIDEHGIDSDIVRVRWLGKEPRQGEDQLISAELVDKAMSRDMPRVDDDEPVVMGIDVARSPLGDESVLFVRRGRDARTFGFRTYRGKNGIQLAGLAAAWAEELRPLLMTPDVFFIDGGGVGASCLDQLTELGYNTVEVNFGGEADRTDRYVRKDAEMWDRAKHWMAEGVLGDDAQLEEQLISRPFEWDAKMRMLLWPKLKVKEEMQLSSPDRADAFCLTFAFPVGRRDLVQHYKRAMGQKDETYASSSGRALMTDNPFARED